MKPEKTSPDLLRDLASQMGHCVRTIENVLDRFSATPYHSFYPESDKIWQMGRCFSEQLSKYAGFLKMEADLVDNPAGTFEDVIRGKKRIT